MEAGLHLRKNVFKSNAILKYYSLLLAKSLREEDCDRFVQQYDNLLPANLSLAEVDQIKEEARLLSDLPLKQFAELEASVSTSSMAQSGSAWSGERVTNLSEREQIIEVVYQDEEEEEVPLLLSEKQQNSLETSSLSGCSGDAYLADGLSGVGGAAYDESHDVSPRSEVSEDEEGETSEQIHGVGVVTSVRNDAYDEIVHIDSEQESVPDSDEGATLEPEPRIVEMKTFKFGSGTSSSTSRDSLHNYEPRAYDQRSYVTRDRGYQASQLERGERPVSSWQQSRPYGVYEEEDSSLARNSFYRRDEERDARLAELERCNKSYCYNTRQTDQSPHQPLDDTAYNQARESNVRQRLNSAVDAKLDFTPLHNQTESSKYHNVNDPPFGFPPNITEMGKSVDTLLSRNTESARMGNSYGNPSRGFGDSNPNRQLEDMSSRYASMQQEQGKYGHFDSNTNKSKPKKKQKTNKKFVVVKAELTEGYRGSDDVEDLLDFIDGKNRKKDMANNEKNKKEMKSKKKAALVESTNSLEQSRPETADKRKCSSTSTTLVDSQPSSTSTTLVDSQPSSDNKSAPKASESKVSSKPKVHEDPVESKSTGDKRAAVPEKRLSVTTISITDAAVEIDTQFQQPDFQEVRTKKRQKKQPSSYVPQYPSGITNGTSAYDQKKPYSRSTALSPPAGAPVSHDGDSQSDKESSKSQPASSLNSSHSSKTWASIAAGMQDADGDTLSGDCAEAVKSSETVVASTAQENDDLQNENDSGISVNEAEPGHRRLDTPKSSVSSLASTQSQNQTRKNMPVVLPKVSHVEPNVNSSVTFGFFDESTGSEPETPAEDSPRRSKRTQQLNSLKIDTEVQTERFASSTEVNTPKSPTSIQQEPISPIEFGEVGSGSSFTDFTQQPQAIELNFNINDLKVTRQNSSLPAGTYNYMSVLELVKNRWNSSVSKYEKSQVVEFCA